MIGNSNKFMLCTDLDRTLIPNGLQPESKNARTLFQKFVAVPSIILVYVTGRHKSLVKQAMDDYQLPQPQYVIGNVGSTIFEVVNGQWRKLLEWDEYIGQDWKRYQYNDIQVLLKDFQEIQLQEQDKQSTYKLSYYVALDVDHETLIERLKRRLEHNTILANVIWSVDEVADIGLLDILPQRASKRQAIEYLMEHCGLTLADVCFAGDSGNDISVMASEIRSILVANATEEVRTAALEQATHNGLSDRLYIAKGNYLGMNGNYSAGILEGIAHYQPEIGVWLKTNQ